MHGSFISDDTTVMYALLEEQAKQHQGLAQTLVETASGGQDGAESERRERTAGGERPMIGMRIR